MIQGKEQQKAVYTVARKYNSDLSFEEAFEKLLLLSIKNKANDNIYHSTKN